MAKTLPTPKAGDKCPIDGGAFQVDPAQEPEGMIDRHTKNADSPFGAARYAEQVRAKVADEGVIHRCVTCGYQSRFKTADQAAASASGASGSGSVSARDQAERDKLVRDQADRARGDQGRLARDQADRDQRDRDQTDRDRGAQHVREQPGD
jgi:hypothetical protein